MSEISWYGAGGKFRLISCEYFISDEAFFLREEFLKKKVRRNQNLNMNKHNAINRLGQKKAELKILSV